jgi:hypothetical protein
MTSFLHRRKMTCAFVLWSAYVATWAVMTGSGPAAVTLWWLIGTTVLGSLQALARGRRAVLCRARTDRRARPGRLDGATGLGGRGRCGVLTPRRTAQVRERRERKP